MHVQRGHALTSNGPGDPYTEREKWLVIHDGITLAAFDTEAEAEAFAADPDA